MALPWDQLAILAFVMFFAAVTFSAAHKLTHRVRGHPYRQFIEENRRSPNRYDRFQAMLVAYSFDRRHAGGLSDETRTSFARLTAVCVFLICTALAVLTAVNHLAWTHAAENTRAEASFASIREQASDASFDDALAVQMALMRRGQAEEVRNATFVPRIADLLCDLTLSNCTMDFAHRPAYTWRGDLTWEERRTGSSRWRSYSCQPKVAFTARHHWIFTETTSCVKTR